MPAIARTVGQLFRAARPENWWFSKVSPLLAVAYLDILRTASDGGRGALLLACFLCSISGVAAYGHVVNDVFDVEADLRAGE